MTHLYSLFFAHSIGYYDYATLSAIFLASHLLYPLSLQPHSYYYYVAVTVAVVATADCLSY